MMDFIREHQIELYVIGCLLLFLLGHWYADYSAWQHFKNIPPRIIPTLPPPPPPRSKVRKAAKRKRRKKGIKAGKADKADKVFKVGKVFKVDKVTPNT